MNKIECKLKEVFITDFSKFNLGSDEVKSGVECSQIYNFKSSKRILKSGMGIRELRTHYSNDLDSFEYLVDYESLGLTHINKVMHFKQYFASSGNTTHRLLIHGSDNKLYLFQMFSGLNTPNWVYELQFDTIPAVLEYKKDGLDSILISANDKLVVWSTGRTPYEITNVPTITSMCAYNDVLYCTIAGDANKIWYTSNLDPESVGEESEYTKYLIMKGDAGDGRKIIMLKENMYIFCDYGIGRINTYAKEGPTYNQIHITSGRINPNTVVNCGGYVVFATTDGLYKFNGSSVERIEIFKNQMTANSNDYAVACYLKGCYYLATRLEYFGNERVGIERYKNNYKNNSIIKLDLNDYSFEIIRGVDVKDMLALKAGIEEKVVLTFNTYHERYIGEITESGGCVFNMNTDACYMTNYISDDLKPITIRSIEFESSKYVAIKIITERGKKLVNSYREGVNKIQTIIPCTKFKVEVVYSNSVYDNLDMFVNWVKIKYETQK